MEILHSSADEIQNILWLGMRNLTEENRQEQRLKSPVVQQIVRVI
jgi:hypothetical protein